jgi:hypothetical protein
MRWLLAALLSIWCIGAQAGEVGPRRALLSSAHPSWILPSIATTQGAADLYFQTQQYWVNGQGYVPYTSQISISRTSAETCQWANGHLTYAPNNTPCITDLGLAVWEGRTNLEPSSGDLTNATYWQMINATAVSSSVLAPDNIGTLQLVTATLSGGNRVATTGIGLAVVNGSTYTVSYYVKAGSSQYAGMAVTNTTVAGAIYNLTGAGNVVSTTGANAVSAAISPCINGIYRISLTVTAASTSLGMAVGVSDGSTYSGAGVLPSASSGTIYASFAQFELGAFPTPYIPTTASTAARASDNLTTVAGSALDTALRATPGSVFVQTNGMQSSSAFNTFIFFSGFWKFRVGSDVNHVDFNNNSIDFNSLVGNGNSYVNRVKSSIIYNGTTTKIIASGGSTSSGSENRSTASGTIGIGNILNGYLERIAVAPNLYQLFPTSP